MNRSPQATIQESEYWIPYHYVTRLPAEGFCPTVSDSWGINSASALAYLLQRLDADRPTSVLEAGCGDGRLTREVALRLPASQVHGFDVSERATALARAMNGDLPNVQFSTGASATAVQGAPFQCAIAMEVLAHLPESELPGFLEAVRGRLVPGGTLYVTVPHANKPVEPKHYRHFTVDSLSSALSACFHVQEVVPFERAGVARRVLEKVLVNRWFALRERHLLSALYQLNERFLFSAREGTCQRLFARAVAPLS